MRLKSVFLLFITVIFPTEVDDRKNWKEKFDYYHTVEEFDAYFDKV